MHRQGRCTNLIEITADELGDDVVTLMLMAVQRDNLELSMKQAIRRYVCMCAGTKIRRVYRRHRTHVKQDIVSTEAVINMCILAFPSLWVSCNTLLCIAAAERI